MKRILIPALLSVIFQACAIIHTPGFNSGYKRLTNEEKEKIFFVRSIDDIPCQNDGRIMAITARQLTGLLNNNGETLLYLWSPHCSSNVCVSLKKIQAFCDKADLRLYVLTEYYTDAFLQNEILSNPMLSVNELYYKTSYCNLYLKRFLSELMPKEQKQSVSYNRYLLFLNGQYIQSYEKIEEIESCSNSNCSDTRP